MVEGLSSSCGPGSIVRKSGDVLFSSGLSNPRRCSPDAGGACCSSQRLQLCQSGYTRDLGGLSILYPRRTSLKFSSRDRLTRTSYSRRCPDNITVSITPWQESGRCAIRFRRSPATSKRVSQDRCGRSRVIRLETDSSNGKAFTTSVCPSTMWMEPEE